MYLIDLSDCWVGSEDGYRLDGRYNSIHDSRHENRQIDFGLALLQVMISPRRSFFPLQRLKLAKKPGESIGTILQRRLEIEGGKWKASLAAFGQSELWWEVPIANRATSGVGLWALLSRPLVMDRT